MEKKNRWDIIVTRLSFDFILPNHYCPSARHFRVKTEILEKMLVADVNHIPRRVITNHRVTGENNKLCTPTQRKEDWTNISWTGFLVLRVHSGRESRGELDSIWE